MAREPSYRTWRKNPSRSSRQGAKSAVRVSLEDAAGNPDSSGLLQIAAQEVEGPWPRVLGRGQIRLLLSLVALRLWVVLCAKESMDRARIVHPNVGFPERLHHRIN